MKQFLYSALLLTAISLVLYSCSSGAYTANPSNPANGSVNPLNPLTASQFTWSGSGEFSADVNGASFSTDSATWYLDTNGANVIIATVGKQTFTLYMISVYGSTVYNMGHLQYGVQGAYSIIDSPTINVYDSYLGNSGEVSMITNDTSVIYGKFYFQGVSSTGQIVNVSNGYFNVPKP